MPDTRQRLAILLLFISLQLSNSEKLKGDTHTEGKEKDIKYNGGPFSSSLNIDDELSGRYDVSSQTRAPLLRLIKGRRKSKSHSLSDSTTLPDVKYLYKHTPEITKRDEKVHNNLPLKKNPFKFKPKQKKSNSVFGEPTVEVTTTTASYSASQEPSYQFPSFQDAKALSKRYNGPKYDGTPSENSAFPDIARVRPSKAKKVLKVVRRKKLRGSPKSLFADDQQYKKRAPVTHTLYLNVPGDDDYRSFDVSESLTTIQPETSQSQFDGDKLLKNSPIYTYSHVEDTTLAPISRRSHSSYLKPHSHNSGAANTYAPSSSGYHDMLNTAYRYATSSELYGVDPPSKAFYSTTSAPQTETPYDYPESSSVYPEVTPFPEFSDLTPWKPKSSSQRGKQHHLTHKTKPKKKLSRYDSRAESHYSSGSEHKSSVIYKPNDYHSKGHFVDTYQSSGQWDSSFDDRFNGLEEEQFSSVPGIAGRDYPTYDAMPKTKFSCTGKGPGYYADVESGCQMFHVCDLTIHSTSFLCPNGTLFNDNLHVCDWWNNVNCGTHAKEPPMGHHTYESHVKDYDDRVIFPYLEKDHLPDEPFDNSLQFY